MSALDPESRQALLAALGQSEFLPRVVRILRISNEGTSTRWQVVTDRGELTFIVDQEDNIRRLDDGRHLITDAVGMRYLVPEADKLDSQSRRCLERYA